MRVLALDPGDMHTAYIDFDGERIHAKGFVDNHEMLRLIDDGKFPCCLFMSIEMIACYGMPVGRTVFDTCVWIGRYIQAAEYVALPHRRVFRKDIKLHLCQSPRAKDGNVRQALIDKYGDVGTKKSPGMLYGVSKHLWAALAVADYSIATK